MPDATITDRIRLLRHLRAVRRFRPDPVPLHVINDLLDVARWTGSAGNRQPWELILLRDKAILHALGEVDGPPGPRHLCGTPMAIVVVLAPGELTAFDEGRLVERIMLAAAAHGLGSSIAMFAGDEQITAAKEILGIPAERTLRTAISIGYPATATARLVSDERKVDTRQPLTTLPLGRKPMTVHVDQYGVRGRAP